jgi:hypothetical protein
LDFSGSLGAEEQGDVKVLGTKRGLDQGEGGNGTEGSREESEDERTGNWEEGQDLVAKDRAHRNSKRPATELALLERGEDCGGEEAPQDDSWESEGTYESIRRGLEKVAKGRRGQKLGETGGPAPQSKKRPPRHRPQTEKPTPESAQPRVGTMQEETGQGDLVEGFSKADLEAAVAASLATPGSTPAGPLDNANAKETRYGDSTTTEDEGLTRALRESLEDLRNEAKGKYEEEQQLIAALESSRTSMARTTLEARRNAAVLSQLATSLDLEVMDPAGNGNCGLTSLLYASGNETLLGREAEGKWDCPRKSREWLAEILRHVIVNTPGALRETAGPCEAGGLFLQEGREDGKEVNVDEYLTRLEEDHKYTDGALELAILCKWALHARLRIFSPVEGRKDTQPGWIDLMDFGPGGGVRSSQQEESCYTLFLAGGHFWALRDRKATPTHSFQGFRLVGGGWVTWQQFLSDAPGTRNIMRSNPALTERTWPGICQRPRPRGHLAQLSTWRTEVGRPWLAGQRKVCVALWAREFLTSGLERELAEGEKWERYVLQDLRKEAGMGDRAGDWKSTIEAWVRAKFPDGGATAEERLEKESRYMEGWVRYKAALTALVPSAAHGDPENTVRGIGLMRWTGSNLFNLARKVDSQEEWSLRARGEGEVRTCESWEMWRPKDKYRELLRMKQKAETQGTSGRNGRNRKWLTQTISSLQEEEWDEEFYRRGLDQQLRYLRVEVATHKARATARRKQVLALSNARLSFLQEQARKSPSSSLDCTESSWQDRRDRGRRTFSPFLRTWPLAGGRKGSDWEVKIGAVHLERAAMELWTRQYGSRGASSWSLIPRKRMPLPREVENQIVAFLQVQDFQALRSTCRVVARETQLSPDPRWWVERSLHRYAYEDGILAILAWLKGALVKIAPRLKGGKRAHSPQAEGREEQEKPWAEEVNQGLKEGAEAWRALLRHAPGYGSVGANNPVSVVGVGEPRDGRGDLGTEEGRQSDPGPREGSGGLHPDRTQEQAFERMLEKAWDTQKAMWTSCNTPHCEYTFQRDGVWSGKDKELEELVNRQEGEHNQVVCPRCGTWTCSDCGASAAFIEGYPGGCDPNSLRNLKLVGSRTNRDRRRDVAWAAMDEPARINPLERCSEEEEKLRNALVGVDPAWSASSRLEGSLSRGEWGDLARDLCWTMAQACPEGHADPRIWTSQAANQQDICKVGGCSEANQLYCLGCGCYLENLAPLCECEELSKEEWGQAQLPIWQERVTQLIGGAPPSVRAADASCLLALLAEIEDLPYLSPAIRILPDLITTWAVAVEDQQSSDMDVEGGRKATKAVLMNLVAQGTAWELMEQVDRERFGAEEEEEMPEILDLGEEREAGVEERAREGETVVVEESSEEQDLEQAAEAKMDQEKESALEEPPLGGVLLGTGMKRSAGEGDNQEGNQEMKRVRGQGNERGGTQGEQWPCDRDRRFKEKREWSSWNQTPRGRTIGNMVMPHDPTVRTEAEWGKEMDSLLSGVAALRRKRTLEAQAMDVDQERTLMSVLERKEPIPSLGAGMIKQLMEKAAFGSICTRELESVMLSATEKQCEGNIHPLGGGGMGYSGRKEIATPGERNGGTNPDVSGMERLSSVGTDPPGGNKGATRRYRPSLLQSKHNGKVGRVVGESKSLAESGAEAKRTGGSTDSPPTRDPAPL